MSLVPLTIDEVVSQADRSPAVRLLTADEQEIIVPVSDCEAEVIYRKLRGESFSRPMAHDLFRAIADSLGLAAVRAVLDTARADSVTGSIVLAGRGSPPPLWCSAGDAMAVAQHTAADVMGTPGLSPINLRAPAPAKRWWHWSCQRLVRSVSRPWVRRRSLLPGLRRTSWIRLRCRCWGWGTAPWVRWAC